MYKSAIKYFGNENLMNYKNILIYWCTKASIRMWSTKLYSIPQRCEHQILILDIGILCMCDGVFSIRVTVTEDLKFK